MTQRNAPPIVDTSASDGFKFAIESIREMSKLQIDMLKTDRDSLAARLERMEARQSREVVAASSNGEGDVLAYLDKTDAIMQRLGYTKRGGNQAPPEPPQRDLVGTIMDALPGLLQAAMQAYAGHMQAQVRIAELSAGVASRPYQAAPIPQQQQTTAPPPQTQPEARGGPQASSTVNEAMRQEIGPDFDMIVSNFHEELAKMDKVITAKFLEGIQVIIKEDAQSAQDQHEIIADHGALLADWYGQIPGNGLEIMRSYKPLMLNVLKSYKPIWDVMSKAPLVMATGFIDGFCNPKQLDEDVENETPLQNPTQ